MKVRPNVYKTLGCSQEDHLPDCMHFGQNGVYMGKHSKECYGLKTGGPCTCNRFAKLIKFFKERPEVLLTVDVLDGQIAIQCQGVNILLEDGAHWSYGQNRGFLLEKRIL